MNESGLSRRDFLKSAAGLGAAAVAFSLKDVAFAQEIQPTVRSVFLISPTDGTILTPVDFNTYSKNGPFAQDFQSLWNGFQDQMTRSGIKIRQTDMYVPFQVSTDGTPTIEPTNTPDTNTQQSISAYFTIDGLDQKGNAISGGLFYVPTETGWNPYTSDTVGLLTTVYGSDRSSWKTIMEVPNPKDNTLLGFEFTDMNTPSKLVAVGSLDSQNNQIVWSKYEQPSDTTTNNSDASVSEAMTAGNVYNVSEAELGDLSQGIQFLVNGTDNKTHKVIMGSDMRDNNGNILTLDDYNQRTINYIQTLIDKTGGTDQDLRLEILNMADVDKYITEWTAQGYKVKRIFNQNNNIAVNSFTNRQGELVIPIFSNLQHYIFASQQPDLPIPNGPTVNQLDHNVQSDIAGGLYWRKTLTFNFIPMGTNYDFAGDMPQMLTNTTDYSKDLWWNQFINAKFNSVQSNIS